MSLRTAIDALRRGDDKLQLYVRYDELDVDEFVHVLKANGSCLRELDLHGNLPAFCIIALRPFLPNIQIVKWHKDTLSGNECDLIMKCVNLKKLKIITDNIITVRLDEILETCIHITELYLGGISWSTTHMLMMREGLAKLPKLSALRLEVNVSDSAIEALAYILESCHSLTECEIMLIPWSEIKLDQAVVQRLANACYKMKRLFISGVTILGANVIWDLPNIECLALTDWLNKNGHVPCILQPIKTNIREIHLGGINIDDSIATSLGMCINRLESLTFDRCRHIKPYSNQIFIGLTETSPLRDLELSGITIDDVVVFQHLRRCTKMKSFVLSIGSITSDLVCIESWSNLQELTIRCDIPRQMLTRLALDLRPLRELRKLHLNGNTHINHEFILSAFQNNTNLQDLETGVDPSNDAYLYFGQMLSKCTNLTNLVLHNCAVGDEEFIHLSNGLQNKSKLKYLTIYWQSKISLHVATAMYRALSTCPNLMAIDICSGYNNNRLFNTFAQHLPRIGSNHRLNGQILCDVPVDVVADMANDLFIRGCLGAGPMDMTFILSESTLDTIGKILHGLHPSSNMVGVSDMVNTEKWKEYKKFAPARRLIHTFLGAQFSQNSEACRFLCKDGDHAILSRVLLMLM